MDVSVTQPGHRRSRVARWRLAAVLGAVLCSAGVGIAALAGLFAVAPAASAAQANPVSASMIEAITAGNSLGITPVRAGMASESPAVTPANAASTALAALGRAGTQVLGQSLAYATVPPARTKTLVWLVSLDPAGGMYSVGLKSKLANFCVAIIDAKTGRWLMATAGSSKSLPALRPIA